MRSFSRHREGGSGGIRRARAPHNCLLRGMKKSIGLPSLACSISWYFKQSSSLFFYQTGRRARTRPRPPMPGTARACPAVRGCASGHASRTTVDGNGAAFLALWSSQCRANNSAQSGQFRRFCITITCCVLCHVRRAVGMRKALPVALWRAASVALWSCTVLHSAPQCKGRDAL